MTDLIHLMSRLVTPQGDILIPEVQDLVAPLAPGEKYVSSCLHPHLCAPYSHAISCSPLMLMSHRDRYDALDYSIADIEHSAGASIALSDDKSTVLMGRMRESSLSLHGIEGAFSAPGSKTVIPSCVSGKFSIRLVPNQTPGNIDPLVVKYLETEFAKLRTKNKLVIDCQHGGKPWLADPDHWNYKAAAIATKVSLTFDLSLYRNENSLTTNGEQAIWGKEPNYTREGGSIPVTLTFAEALGVNVLLLPMGRGDDGAQ